MTEWFARAAARYGQQVRLRRKDGERTVKAFLQPVEERRKAAPYTVTPLGAVDDRLWLYLGQAELTAGDEVAWDGRTFSVRDSRPYYVGEELSHWWATLALKGEAAE